MPRCCQPIHGEFEPSYASVLVHGGLGEKQRADLRAAEEGAIVSCFTAWCPSCQRPYLLTEDVGMFPSASAHHAHKLILMIKLKPFLS